MTLNEAYNTLKEAGCSNPSPLAMAYDDGYYNAKTMNNPTPAQYYIGVWTPLGYYKTKEIIEQYEAGLKDGSK